MCNFPISTLRRRVGGGRPSGSRAHHKAGGARAGRVGEEAIASEEDSLAESTIT